MTRKTTARRERTPEEFIELEFARFKRGLGRERDPVALVLRAHLFAEAVFDRMILAKLPRGDKVLDSAQLTYLQKLFLLEATQSIPDGAASAFRGLNKVRNQCAHELGKSIQDADVTRIGSPLGAEFAKMRRHCGYDVRSTLGMLLSYLIGFLTALCVKLEEAAASKSRVFSKQDQSVNSAMPGLDKGRDPGVA